MSSRLPLVFLRPALIVCTALSANPLLDGWYGEHLMCFMPFAPQNCPNSSLVKQLPLSDTMSVRQSDVCECLPKFGEIDLCSWLI